MTFSRYIDSFDSKDEFMKAFSPTTCEEAQAFINAEKVAIFIKANMIMTCRQEREGLSNGDNTTME